MKLTIVLGSDFALEFLELQQVPSIGGDTGTFAGDELERILHHHSVLLDQVRHDQRGRPRLARKTTLCPTDRTSAPAPFPRPLSPP